MLRNLLPVFIAIITAGPALAGTDICVPPKGLVQESLASEDLPGGKFVHYKGVLNGVKGEWSAMRVDRPFKPQAAESKPEHDKLIQKLEKERMLFDGILGRDNHVIHDMELFANGIEAYGSYIDSEAESKFYMNWEFGVDNDTCIIGFESDEKFSPKAKDLQELRKPLVLTQGGSS